MKQVIRPEITVVIELLKKQYGIREMQPHNDPLAELVRTILSQNTSDANSHPAFKALREKFPGFDQMLEAPLEEIERPIRGGGLARIKAQRIRETLREIKRKQGNLDLEFLKNMPVERAREWLVDLPGVGYKTASCVLLFAFGSPVMPVDTHIFRVTKRLGLIGEGISLVEAHIRLNEIVPPADVYEFHVLTIEHGRRTCIARRPRCASCVLNEVCRECQLSQRCVKEDGED
ncbi:MAG: endonuclease III [Dehalococcoidales bacterium]|nr:endonuclease III [Dehalococcoidales bacterium]